MTITITNILQYIHVMGLHLQIQNKLQVSSEPSFTLNSILGLLQTSCLLWFLVFGKRDALQIQRSDDWAAISISLKGFSVVLKTLTVLLD